MTLADRLVAGLRAQEQEDGYHLERAEIDGDTDAINWLLDYVRDESGATWGETGASERRRIATALRRCRDRFNGEWRARGGRES